MSVITNPNAPVSVTQELAQLTVANANRDGTGTLVALKTGAATRGSFVNSVDITAPGTTTAGMIRFYHFDGANTRLIGEVVVPAITVGAGVAGFSTTWTPTGNIAQVPNGWILKASTNNAETFNCVVKGGDY